MISDEVLGTPSGGTSTPAGEPADDFFSSWDKPTIKRPSNPPSRTGTPPVVSRTASPFLTAGNTNGAARPKSPSPLSAATADAENALPAPTAIRTTSSSAVRKGPAVGGAKRTNILGAKKGQKLGAKKVTEAEIDFEAAEKAAKAEAERIEKLGYDPEAEAAAEKAKSPTISATRDTSIIAPTPISPPQTGYGNKQQHQRSPSEIERLGMGMGRLGFGQMTKSQPASTGPAPKKLGFGAVGTAKTANDGESLPRLQPHHTNPPSRRLRRLRPPKVRHPKRHLLRRVLRPQQLRPLRAARSQTAPARLRRRHIDLQQRVLREA